MPRNLLLALPVPGLWSLHPAGLGMSSTSGPGRLGSSHLVQFWEGRRVFPSQQTPRAHHWHPRGDPGAFSPALQRPGLRVSAGTAERP